MKELNIEEIIRDIDILSLKQFLNGNNPQYFYCSKEVAEFIMQYIKGNRICGLKIVPRRTLGRTVYYVR